MGWFIYHPVPTFEEIPDLVPIFKLLCSLGHERQNTDEIPMVFENLTFPKWVGSYHLVRNFEEISDLIPKFKLLFSLCGYNTNIVIGDLTD